MQSLRLTGDEKLFERGRIAEKTLWDDISADTYLAGMRRHHAWRQ
jgi:hypothetical protein